MSHSNHTSYVEGCFPCGLGGWRRTHPFRMEFLESERKIRRGMDEFAGAVKAGVQPQSTSPGAVEAEYKRLERFASADKKLAALGVDPKVFDTPQLKPKRTQSELLREGIIKPHQLKLKPRPKRKRKR